MQVIPRCTSVLDIEEKNTLELAKERLLFNSINESSGVLSSIWHHTDGFSVNYFSPSTNFSLEDMHLFDLVEISRLRFYSEILNQIVFAVD